MAELIESLRSLHSAEGISQIVQAGGLFVLIAIIFAETGLLVGCFLPGDSLLITAGVLANPLNPNHVSSMNIWILNLTLAVAGIVGDQVGYWLGLKTGTKIYDRPDGRIYKRRHLEHAREFYKRYGGISIALGRYVPIVRTFVPFVAGVAQMEYRKFVAWNIGGGIVWVTSLLWIGYFLGQTPLANRLDKIILLVIFVSILPIIIGSLKKMTTKTPRLVK